MENNFTVLAIIFVILLLIFNQGLKLSPLISTILSFAGVVITQIILSRNK